MRYDAEHKERTRARVLDEAVKAIRTEGPHKIGVAGVMARAGLTHGGFYAHFESKDDLVLAALDQMFASARGTFERIAAKAAGKPPTEALRIYVNFYLSPGHRDARETGCPLPLLASDLPRMPGPARDNFARGVARLTGAIQSVLEKTGHPDPEDAASSALAEMIGALSLARAIPDLEQSDAVLRRSRESVLARLGVAKETEAKGREA
jgi:TetR/AcrR family transcriptional regulator, transcriptional repressor for nem operon